MKRFLLVLILITGCTTQTVRQTHMVLMASRSYYAGCMSTDPNDFMTQLICYNKAAEFTRAINRELKSK